MRRSSHGALRGGAPSSDQPCRTRERRDAALALAGAALQQGGPSSPTLPCQASGTSIVVCPMPNMAWRAGCRQAGPGQARQVELARTHLPRAHTYFCSETKLRAPPRGGVEWRAAGWQVGRPPRCYRLPDELRELRRDPGWRSLCQAPFSRRATPRHTSHGGGVI